MSAAAEQVRPVGTLRVRRKASFKDFTARSRSDVTGSGVNTVTRYAPDLVLQVQVESPAALVDLVRGFSRQALDRARSSRAVPTAPKRPEAASRFATAAGSYRAGEVIACSAPDGSVLATPQIAVFLSDVDGIDDADPVIGHVDDLGALRRLVDAVAGQPASGEFLTVLFKTTLVVV